MKTIVVIFCLLVLNIAAFADGFNEDSLYTAIKNESNDNNKLIKEIEFIEKAENIDKVIELANDTYWKMAPIAIESGNGEKLHSMGYGLASNYYRRTIKQGNKEWIDSALVIMDTLLNYYDGKNHVYMQMYQIGPSIYLEGAKKSQNAETRAAYLRKANELCDLGYRLLELNNQKMYKHGIDNAKAGILIYERRFAEAKAIINNIPANDAHDVKIEYWRAVGNYKNMLSEMESASIESNKRAGMQSLESMYLNDVQYVFEEEIKNLNEEETQRTRNYNRRATIFEKMKGLMRIFTVLISLLTIGMAVFWIRIWKSTKLIGQQNAIIGDQNRQLEMLIDEEKSQYQEIKDQSVILKEDAAKAKTLNIRLLDGLRYAKHIQDAVIPSQSMTESIFGECLIYYRPLQIVSGDFYWAVQTNKLKILAVCDCTGHGVPGALLSILGTSYLYDIISYKDYKEPDASAILNLLRKMVLTGFGEECDDGMDMGLVIIDEGKHKMHFAGAMRPMYLMRDGKINVHKPNRMPIGRYVIKDKSFTEQIIDTLPGDRIYMFSDGITDVFNENRSRKFSERELREILINCNGMNFASQKKTLEDFYGTWGESSIIDDQLLVGIELR